MADPNVDKIDDLEAPVVPDEDTEWGRALERPPDVDDTDSCQQETDHEDVDVAIVGGGLVGLAVAIGLLRNGISCKIYERAPELRSVSQGILAIQPNGLAALEYIHPDLRRLIQETGCDRLVHVRTTIDEHGSVTEKTTATGQDYMDKYGRLKIGTTWHNMQQLLASLLPAAAGGENEKVVVTGRSLQSFHEEEDSVMLHFQNGSVVRARAVLACDGIFSVARRQVVASYNNDNDNVATVDSPIFFGQLNWATIIETSKLPPNLHPPNAVRYIEHSGEPRWMSMLNDGGMYMYIGLWISKDGDQRAVDTLYDSLHVEYRLCAGIIA